MAFCDFVVKHDPSKEAPEELTKKILYSIIIKRLKAHKPAVMFVGGDSGEGKSFTALRLQELLLEIQGLNTMDYIEAINVYTPLEYPEKLDALLFDKELKKANIICMHEAREIVKAKLWYTFLNQSISDVNAMSRTIKRLCIIVISQFIRDISNDIRYTLNYYCIVRRPKQKRARLYINVLWKDDRDLEKPKLRRRKLSGYVVNKYGKYRRYVPQYLELRKPSAELIKIFEKKDFESKSGIIKKKINSLIKEIKSDVGAENIKVASMVDHYLKNPDNLGLIGRRIRGKWKVNPKFRDMHDLTKIEAKEFEKKLNEAFTQRGAINE